MILDGLDFRAVADAMAAGIAVLDPQGVLLYANAAVERITGDSVRGMIGRDIRAVAAGFGFEIHTEGMDTLPLAQVARTRQPLRDVLLRRPHDGGGESWYAVSFVPVVRDDALRYIVLTGEDVTAHRREEDAQRAGYAQLRAVLEHAPIGACIINESGLLETVNTEFCDLFGCDAETVTGQSYRSLLPPRLRAAVEERFARRLADERDVLDDLETLDRHGGVKRLRTAYATFTGVDGRPRVAVFVQDMTAQNSTEERLTRLALYDGLTGLPNRLAFSERLTRTLAAARQSWQMASVLFMDFDGFKRVNDMWGHDAGDTVLRILAQRLRASVREGDEVARRGGDEFLVLVPALAVPEEAATLARRIIRACGEAMTVKGHTVKLGVSIGIAIYPFDGQDAEAMIVAADRAMYAAKRRGKGQYVFAQRDGAA